MDKTETENVSKIQKNKGKKDGCKQHESIIKFINIKIIDYSKNKNKTNDISKKVEKVSSNNEIKRIKVDKITKTDEEVKESPKEKKEINSKINEINCAKSVKLKNINDSVAIESKKHESENLFHSKCKEIQSQFSNKKIKEVEGGSLNIEKKNKNIFKKENESKNIIKDAKTICRYKGKENYEININDKINEETDYFFGCDDKEIKSLGKKIYNSKNNIDCIFNQETILTLNINNKCIFRSNVTKHPTKIKIMNDDK